MARSDIDKLHLQAKKALKQAVKKAILQHELAGVPAVIWQNGKVVRLPISRTKKKP